MGWLGEVLKIPRYVRDANENPKHMEELIGRMSRNKKVRLTNEVTYLGHVCICNALLVAKNWCQLQFITRE